MLFKWKKKYTAIAISVMLIIPILLFIKGLHFCWAIRNIGDVSKEKDSILRRSKYLQSRILVTPQQLIQAMPQSVDSQYQGEWAMYSCSMYAKALTNIAHLYPAQKTESAAKIEKLIDIVLSQELRNYDRERWGEDPLIGIDGELSHISYYSILAWMIGEYKSLDGGKKYDELYHKLCAGMNRRILSSSTMNLPTYPGEGIYVPDMLVAIVALEQYSQLYDGMYHSTVEEWVRTMKERFTDPETNLMLSKFSVSGNFTPGNIQGSYSALNCFYLTMVDKEYAAEQYQLLKRYFLQTKPISGIKEYYDHDCKFGFDIDAGPIIFNLSPSGTAFALGATTFFDDKPTRKALLRTAELAGTTISFRGRSHYLLADYALVGEAITLAGRTSIDF